MEHSAVMNDCEHDWDGDGIETELVDAATCSRCGLDAISFTMREESRAMSEESMCVTCKKPIEPSTLETHPKAKRCAECSKAALAKISERVDTSFQKRRSSK
jgi:hypothetical protein